MPNYQVLGDVTNRNPKTRDNVAKNKKLERTIAVNWFMRSSP